MQLDMQLEQLLEKAGQVAGDKHSDEIVRPPHRSAASVAATGIRPGVCSATLPGRVVERHLLRV